MILLIVFLVPVQYYGSASLTVILINTCFIESDFDCSEHPHVSQWKTIYRKLLGVTGGAVIIVILKKLKIDFIGKCFETPCVPGNKHNVSAFVNCWPNFKFRLANNERVNTNNFGSVLGKKEQQCHLIVQVHSLGIIKFILYAMK